MKLGIGFALERDPFECGREIIRHACARGNISRADMVLAFCTRDVDHAQFLRGIQAAAGTGVPVFGGTSIGIICNDTISYAPNSAAALVFQADTVRVRMAVASDVDVDAEKAGAELARQLGSLDDDRFAFLLYDMVKRESTATHPPIINSLKSILSGYYSVAPSRTPVFGGGIIADYLFSQSLLFNRHAVAKQSLLGLAFSGDFSYDYRVMHGCTPFDGDYYTITKTDGPLILELDGKPATAILDDIYGSQNWQKEMPVKDLTIGINLGETYGPYHENNYITRLIAGIMPLAQGIMTPEPDWVTGTQIQFMIRDNEEMIESARRNSAELLDSILAAGKKPRLGLYVDCAGRTAYFSNSITEEAAVVQSIFNHHQIPLFGFYSGIEIAPLGGATQGLEWTGVLIVISTD